MNLRCKYFNGVCSGNMDFFVSLLLKHLKEKKGGPIMDDILRINPALLREAKRQARLKNISLNEIVEAFIQKFISQSKEGNKQIKITPFIESLGVDLNLSLDFDEREAYRKYLEEKYK